MALGVIQFLVVALVLHEIAASVESSCSIDGHCPNVETEGDGVELLQQSKASTATSQTTTLSTETTSTTTEFLQFKIDMFKADPKASTTTSTSLTPSLSIELQELEFSRYADLASSAYRSAYCPLDRPQCNYRVPSYVGLDTPLLIVLHGFGNHSGTLFHDVITKYTGDADAFGGLGMVIAFPTGLQNKASKMRGWRIGKPPPAMASLGAEAMKPYTREETLADIKYLTHDLVNDVRQQVLAVSEHLEWKPRFIFATGISQGAVMAYALAVEGAVDAIAAVSGALYNYQIPIPPKRRPYSLIAFHGTVDPVTFWDGDQAAYPPYTSTDDAIKYWCKANDFDSAPEEEIITLNDKAVLNKTWHHPGRQFPRFEFYVEQGRGHIWPTNRSVGVEGIDVMKRFFWDYYNFYTNKTQDDDDRHHHMKHEDDDDRHHHMKHEDHHHPDHRHDDAHHESRNHPERPHQNDHAAHHENQHRHKDRLHRKLDQTLDLLNKFTG